MFITKESDYAVRIIRALSQNTKRSARELCEEELVPRQYGYKILKKLEKAGLLRCYRGAAGGYALAKPSAAITLFDVLDAVDDALLFTECLEHGFSCPLNRGGKECGIHQEFARIQKLIIAVLKGKSLAEIFAPDMLRKMSGKAKARSPRGSRNWDDDSFSKPLAEL